MSTAQRIGFGKKVRIDWLLLALRLRANAQDFTVARGELEELIAATNPGKVAIAKIMSNVRQVVFEPAPEVRQFADNGVKLFQERGEIAALPVIWGLTITSYSFFGTCAETIGRLLKLHDEFTAAEMVRRLKEKTGDRAFVARVGRYNLSSQLDWGLVTYNAKSKRYGRGKAAKVSDPAMLGWLLEAVLRASNKTAMNQSQLLSSNLLSPFTITPMPMAQLAAANPRLQVIRESLNEELLAIEE